MNPRAKIAECMHLLEKIQETITDKDAIGHIVQAAWELHYARERLKRNPQARRAVMRGRLNR